MLVDCGWENELDVIYTDLVLLRRAHVECNVASPPICLTSVHAAKSLQSCPTLCNPIDGSSPGPAVPGILQARTLEWVAISSSNAWKWKVKVKSLSRVRLLAIPWTAAYQAPPSMGLARQEYWTGVPLPSPTSVHSPWIFPISLRPDLRHFWFSPFICWKTIELQWLSLRNFPSVLSLAMYCVLLCLFFHHHLPSPEFYNFMTFLSRSTRL